MMDQEKVRLKIKQLANKLVNDQIDFIEGCRQIAQLAGDLDCHDTNQDFLFIRGVSSESDHIPSGKARGTCSPKHLAELNLEKEEFVTFYKESVLDFCQNIIALD